MDNVKIHIEEREIVPVLNLIPDDLQFTETQYLINKSGIYKYGDILPNGIIFNGDTNINDIF